MVWKIRGVTGKKCLVHPQVTMYVIKDGGNPVRTRKGRLIGIRGGKNRWFCRLCG
jgi:hypothetical protein